MKRIAVIILVAGFMFSTYADEPPSELKHLQAIRAKKIKEIDTAHIRALEKLKLKYTKRGDLVSANIIAAELSKFEGASTPVQDGSTEPISEVKFNGDITSLLREDQKIIKGLKFSNPVIAPIGTRHWTFIKGQIDVRNSSPSHTIADKLQIEIRMLCRNKDKEWSVIRCIRGIGITDKGSQTIGISFRETNYLFEKLYADRSIRPEDTYAVVRYLGIVIFESPGKAYSSFPKNWWQDDSLVYNN